VRKKRNKNGKSIPDHSFVRQRAGSAGSIESLIKRKREEEERIEAEKERTQNRRKEAF